MEASRRFLRAPFDGPKTSLSRRHCRKANASGRVSTLGPWLRLSRTAPIEDSRISRSGNFLQLTGAFRRCRYGCSIRVPLYATTSSTLALARASGSTLAICMRSHFGLGPLKGVTVA